MLTGRKCLFLTIQKPFCTLAPRQYWCRLEQNKFVGWKLAEHAEHVNPAFTVLLDEVMALTLNAFCCWDEL